MTAKAPQMPPVGVKRPPAPAAPPPKRIAVVDLRCVMRIVQAAQLQAAEDSRFNELADFDD